ncbi:hypothetical protein [Planctomicrobium piriforme]|uniref:Antitoxin ParD1/3/4 n=1 Tax=Planctomicrobium piriforme TaxID=1576369 RepID=A0A1I3KTG5_9PLAN|nr:hypothetical protein [Planctomicrobium piriforme]SFI75793.1 hypothetical protein SAMN05421753_11240 [Planctomicrobium piriforme]
MLVEIADEIQIQAVAAGFATIQDYIADLVERDAERVAIQKGIDDWKAGRVQSFDEFDRGLRQEFGFSPRT